MKTQPNKEVTLHLGTTEGNNAVTLSGQEASRHKWIMGISGSGKSVFIVWLMLQLLRSGVTVICLDPHGDVCRLLLSLLDASGYFKSGGEKAFNRLWFVDLGRKDATIPFNALRLDHTTSYHAASDFLDAITRAFPSSSGSSTPLLDNLIQYTAFVLAETGQPATSFQRFLTDKPFRSELLTSISDPQVVQFFEFTLAKENTSSLIASTMRRLDLLIFSPTIRAALGASENRLDFRNLYDTGTSCLISLEGCSESEKKLLGCLCMTHIEQSLLSRLSLPPEKRTPVHIFVDEAPLFISQSESAFTTILEQARKAGAVLTFVHQGLHQLPKNMAGALQNCLPLLLRAGSIDSSELASRFFRPVEETEKPLFDFFSPPSHSLPLVFQGVKLVQAARLVFESLRRQEAICMLPDGAVKITTPTLPVRVDQKQLTAIEDAYAHRLLTPITALHNASAPHVNISPAPSPQPRAKRRIVLPPSYTASPLQTFVGVSGSEAEIQALVSLYGSVTVAQVAKLLQKSENTARNKLNKLVDAGILITTSVPRTTASGKTPLVYSLKGKKPAKSFVFLDHALAATDILINTALLSTVVSDCTITDLRGDDQLKSSPIKLRDGTLLVPDGLVRLVSKGYEYALYFEIDRNSEGREKILSKLAAYQSLASQCDCIAVAFCITEGADLRVKTLRKWAQEVLQDSYKKLFLFAPIDLTSLTPETFYLRPLWVSVEDTTLQPLLEL